MREYVHGYALGVRDLALRDGLGDTVVAELEAVYAFLCEQEGLREVLTDRAISGNLRASVLRELLGSRISTHALELASTFVSAEIPSELMESLLLAGSLVASTVVLVEPGGYATARRIVGYADALIEASEPEALRAWLRELQEIALIVEGNRELSRVLGGFGAEITQREAIVAELFGARVGHDSNTLLRVIVNAPAIRSVAEVLSQVVSRIATRLREFLAEVVSARRLDETVHDRLKRTLEDRSGRTLDVSWRVDAGLGGGMVAVIGDVVYDVTVVRELKRVRQSLAAG
ncbi:MAG: F0F1 ATP synthase subunit delta [Ferrimicrobium sp.]